MSLLEVKQADLKGRKPSLPPMKPKLSISLDDPLNEELFDMCRDDDDGDAGFNLEHLDGLLKHGADLEAVSDEEGMTPLLLALNHKKEELALELLKRGASALKKCHEDKSNALLLSIKKGMKKVVKYLCTEMDKDLVGFKVRDHSGDGAGFLALKNDEEEMFEWLEEADGLDSLVKTNAFGFTPLARLARSNKEEDRALMLRLMKHVDASQELEDGWTALTWACAAADDNVESVKLLVQSGKFYNLLSCDTKDNGLLHVCAKFNNPLTMAYLLSLDDGHEFKVVLNIKNDMSDTPLMIACKLGLVECAKLLIDAGARVNVFDNNHMTPLMHAVVKGHADIAKLLLAVPDVEVNFQDHAAGDTALHFAVAKGDAALVKLLLESGADPKIPNQRNKYASETATDDSITALFE